jgi:L-lactate dehydrogenase complex protein LldG
MSTDAARAAILARVRAAVGVAATDDARIAAVRHRLAAHAAGIVPARAQQQPERLIALFRDMLHSVEATTVRVAFDAIAPEIARYLAAQQLPLSLRCGSDPLIAAIDWTAIPGLALKAGPAHKDDAVSLTHAFAAAAETGTLFLASGPGNPVTLSFLPETNIVLVRTADILGSYEAALGRLRALYPDGAMPRTLNLVSGPSRTADIEQTIVTGAHGPRRLHVVIVD